MRGEGTRSSHEGSGREGRSPRGGREAVECRGRMHEGDRVGALARSQGALRPTLPQTETLHRG